MTKRDHLNVVALPAHGDPNWRDHALCVEVGVEVFFPEKGGSVRDAKKVCARCPVRDECLEDALRFPGWTDQFGVRGGLSERERRRLRGEQAS